MRETGIAGFGTALQARARGTGRCASAAVGGRRDCATNSDVVHCHGGMLRGGWGGGWRGGWGDRGQASGMVVILVPTLVLAAGLVVDGGDALAAHVTATHAADEAARAGAQQLDLAIYRRTGRIVLDPAAARRAADGYLRAAGVTGQVTVDGNQVRITATARVRTRLLGLAGIATLTVHASGAARPVRGVTGPSP